ncbi:MAG: NAD(P)(+) transhydrogenase (Re/Si-specific) subunit beta [Spirochaetia bacterium]|nr:NAD(P)(+) transhydrogenase (Re/Si-specific) subunit beta [Spirochaetia bacterium]
MDALVGILHADWFINLVYLVAVLLFVFGLKKLSSPRTARQGNTLSMSGMFTAIVITLFDKNIVSFEMIIIGIAAGAVVGIFMAKKVAMTSMPEMVAILNGFGGIGSALVALAEYYTGQNTITQDMIVYVTLNLSIIVGTLTFTGSVVAFGKLYGIIPGQPLIVTTSKIINVLLLLGSFVMATMLYSDITRIELLYGILVSACVLGITLVVPIGGADMPVVVSLLNSYSGIAVAMTGFVLHNNALIVVGSLVGASGIILTNIMCKGMNRSLANVLFGGFGTGDSGPAVAPKEGGVLQVAKSASPEEAAMVMDIAEKVIIVPGYGMAVSQAQHIVKKLADLLEKRGTSVKYAIHPVAGRMPGHMNVLLAEAGVEYDKLYDLEINDEFARTDVVIVIGANDVVNPGAKTNPQCAIYGMPVFDVENAKTVFVLKRSLNPGFAGIENELFFLDNTLMVFGDAKKTIENFVTSLEEMD